MEHGKPHSRWREAMKVIAGTLCYMLPLFWLWSATDYPDGLGVHIEAHGKVGLLENWWYSYLLIERHRPLDVLTFVYMWAAVLGLIGWIISGVVRERRYTDNERRDAKH